MINYYYDIIKVQVLKSANNIFKWNTSANNEWIISRKRPLYAVFFLHIQF